MPRKGAQVTEKRDPLGSVPQRTDSRRWGRILVFGLLAETATVMVIVLAITLHSRFAPGEGEAAREAFGVRAGSILGPFVGALFCFGAAYLATRPLLSAFRLHGVLVGAVAGALTVPGLIAAPFSLRFLYVGAIALKLLAGLGAGTLTERRCSAFLSVGAAVKPADDPEV
jgi:hypothetical protein